MTIYSNFINVGDVHLGIKQGNDTYHDYLTERLLAVMDYANEHDIHHVVFNGDFFDHRRFIPAKVLNFVIHTLPQVANQFGIRLHILVGNHDIYNLHDLSITSLDILQHPCYRIYKQPTFISELGIIVVPWVCRDNYESIVDFLQLADPSIPVFGHFELAGFKMYANSMESHHEPFDLSVLKRFDQVFSGHFHHPTSNKNIHYLGSFAALTRSDLFDLDKKGFHVFHHRRPTVFIKHDHHLFVEFEIDNEFDQPTILKKSINKNVDLNLNTSFTAFERLEELKKELSAIALSVKVNGGDFLKKTFEKNDENTEIVGVKDYLKKSLLLDSIATTYQDYMFKVYDKVESENILND